MEYLERLFGKKVDVITKDGIVNIRRKEVSRAIEILGEAAELLSGETKGNRLKGGR